MVASYRGLVVASVAMARTAKTTEAKGGAGTKGGKVGPGRTSNAVAAARKYLAEEGRKDKDRRLIGKRLAQFRQTRVNAAGKVPSFAEFARAFGAGKQVQQQYEAGLSAPSGLILARMVRAYPDLDVRWLLTGEK